MAGGVLDTILCDKVCQWNIVESAVKHYNSDVVRSWQPAIFAGNCPFLAGYFSMSKKKMWQKNPYSNIHINNYIV